MPTTPHHRNQPVHRETSLWSPGADPATHPGFSRRNALVLAGGLGSLFIAPRALAAESLQNPLGSPLTLARRRFDGDPGANRIYYGAVIDTNTTVRAFEREMGHRLGCRRNYHSAHAPQALVKRARQEVAARRFPVLSITPPGDWRSVANGSHNGWLDQILDGLAAVDAPMTFTIHHEPENNVNGDGNTPQWHKEMTEFVFDRAAVRAPRVYVNQILMAYTFDPVSRRDPDAWVAPSPKIFGLDAYNWWEPHGHVDWISFKKLVRRAYPWIDGRPIVIGEYGVREDPNRPGRSARWMRRAYKFAVETDIIAMNYFNTHLTGGAYPWKLDGERLRVFRRKLHARRSVRMRYAE